MEQLDGTTSGIVQIKYCSRAAFKLPVSECTGLWPCSWANYEQKTTFYSSEMKIDESY